MPILIGKPDTTGGGSSPETEARITAIEAVNTQQNTQISDTITKVDTLTVNSTSLAGRVTDLENSSVDYTPQIQDLQAKDTSQDGLITLANGKNDEQDARLDSNESSISSQASLISTVQTTLLNKADLVAGKIPMVQLPDLPVGRKVSVANEAARLALSVHPDLTIAYQIDTADAWVLDALELPSVAANWDKLGNAQAVGVQSFNGRTGNVVPASGDYTTAQITTTTDRAFISDADRIRWDNKSTSTQVEAAVSTLRTEVAAGYVKTETLSANNGIATLGSDGKVPTSQLPPLGLTTTQSQRVDSIETTANAAASKNTEQDLRLTALETASTSNFIPLTQKGAANGVAPLGSAGKVPAANLLTNVAGGVPLLNASVKVEAQFIETGTANGVAPLGAASKVPMVNILTDVAGGVPKLDVNGKVLSSQLPDTTTPQSSRIWRDVTSSRVRGTYYTNNSGNEMQLHLGSNNVNDGSYFNIQVRQNSSSPVFSFICNSTNITSGGPNTRAFGVATIPVGWEYSINSSNINSRTILSWYELS